ncbi:MAG: hypothetical protein RLZZ605_1532 [Bacteroidota bacterium]|jgi:hypothetical protein
MKKLFIILVLTLVSCSTDSEPQQTQSECYTIIARGIDARGNYIIINYGGFAQKRYSVENYLDWINQTKICEPITLTEQPL